MEDYKIEIRNKYGTVIFNVQESKTEKGLEAIITKDIFYQGYTQGIKPNEAYGKLKRYKNHKENEKYIQRMLDCSVPLGYIKKNQ